MKDLTQLGEDLRAMDGRGYKALKAIKGSWRHDDFVLHVDHVQGDPYAAPSRIRATLPPETTGLPAHASANRSRALGTAAFLARAFGRAARDASRSMGTGKSGRIRMAAPGQEVVDQTALLVAGDGGVEARFTVGLPARGRRVKGHAAAELMTEIVPELVLGTLRAETHDADELRLHADTNEDADHLRELLPGMGLIAFVADGASLPRRTGVDDRPLEGEEVVLFRSPDSLRVEVELPNANTVAGMGVREGITLVVGGGFHGKSTLLRALEAGVYNHRPGDGRAGDGGAGG